MTKENSEGEQHGTSHQTKTTIYYGIDLFPVYWHFYNLLDDWILSTSLRNLFGLSSQYFFSFFSFVSLNIYITCSFQPMSIFFVGIADFTSTYSLTHLLFYIYILTFYNSHLYFSIHLLSSHFHSHRFVRFILVC